MEPGRHFHDNWHIQATAEHLEAVLSGEIKNIIFNVPPRHMKSITVCVGFPCYAWIEQPNLQFLFASYGGVLSTRDSVKCRRLLGSPWYQANWGSTFHLVGDQNQKQRFENNHTGYRIATSVGGALIGEGGDIIVVDDPHNTMEVESEVVRQNVLDWWDTALQTRLNDPKTGRKIVIMQRLHESDLTGHILANELGWDHLCFPAEFETNHPFPTQSSLGFSDPRTKEGELLWNNRFGTPELRKLQSSLGTYGSAGQLQQRPSPKGGGILQESWWKEWTKKNPNTGEPLLPEVSFVLQSWDTAYSEKDTASYSARTTWVVFEFQGRYNALLLSKWRDRVPYHVLRKEATEAAALEQPDAIIIEKKASGQSLLTDLRQAGLPVVEYLPDRDKVSRAHASSILLENGCIWYVDKRWAREVIDHCAKFPAGDGADIVDTCTQAWLRLRTMWYLTHAGDDLNTEDKDKDEPYLRRVKTKKRHRKALYG